MTGMTSARNGDQLVKTTCLTRKILTAWKHSPSPKGWQAEPDGVVNKTPTNGVAVIAVKKDRIAKDGDYNLTSVIGK